MGKILFIRRAGAYGGIEVLLLDWIRAIDHGTNEVAVASTLDCFSEKIKEYSLPVACKTAALPVIGGFLSIYREWYAEIRRFSPGKIVILQSNLTEVPLAAVLAAYVATRGNVYMTEHVAWPVPPEKTRSVHFGFLPGVGFWWYRMMWEMRLRGSLSQRVLAVSEGVRNTLLMYGYPPAKIAVVNHGVDLERYSPDAARGRDWRRDHGIPGDSTVLVSTARLASEKGLDRLVLAFSELSARYGNLWLLFAGEGPARVELEAEARAAGGSERIRFLGLVDNVPDLLRACDIFVLPSDREGLSVSLTEAMATGLVCVATDVSGSNEVIVDGTNGFLVKPSAAGVLNGLQEALRLTDSVRRSIGAQARWTISERFEKRKSTDDILRLLEIDGVAGRT